MKSKAEKRALEAYPECMVYNDLAMEYEDINGCYRTGFEAGYEKAEKDIKMEVKRWLTEIHRVCDITDENGYRIELRDLVASFEREIEEELK